MANVTLKGGVVKEYENGTTAMEIAKSIGMGLYKAVCICKINGEYRDLRTFLPLRTMRRLKRPSATPHRILWLRQSKDFIPKLSLR